MSLPNTTYIDSYIRDGQQSVLSIGNFYETMLVGNADNPNHIFRIPINDFFIKYKKELEPTIRIFNVPESMFYKPKMVSYNLYDTTELWLGLLRLNNMRNSTEFYHPIIRIYEPTQLKQLINIFFTREGKRV